MTRKKVKLAFITNDSSRKATYKKRKKGLMKKVNELSTLCGIDACAIIYSQYESQPEVWPNTLGVQRVLAQFKRMPEMEQSKKMVNQESFMRQRIAKANEQLKKQQKDNHEKEMTEVMYQCLAGKGLQNLILPDLNDLSWLIDQNLKAIYKRIEVLKKKSAPNQVEPPVAQTQQFVASSSSGIVAKGVVHGEEHKPVVDFTANFDGMQRPQWFGEWPMNNPTNDQPPPPPQQQQLQQMGFGRGEETMMPPFGEGTNAMWSSAFFP